jgi:hypothetical protein
VKRAWRSHTERQNELKRIKGFCGAKPTQKSGWTDAVRPGALTPRYGIEAGSDNEFLAPFNRVPPGTHCADPPSTNRSLPVLEPVCECRKRKLKKGDQRRAAWCSVEPLGSIASNCATFSTASRSTSYPPFSSSGAPMSWRTLRHHPPSVVGCHQSGVDLSPHLVDPLRARAGDA